MVDRYCQVAFFLQERIWIFWNLLASLVFLQTCHQISPQSSRRSTLNSSKSKKSLRDWSLMISEFQLILLNGNKSKLTGFFSFIFSSPSPEPVYSSDGKRLNTREIRTKRKLEDTRHQLITQMKELNPHYMPPSDYRAPNVRVQERVLIPQDEHPGRFRPFLITFSILAP